MSNFIDQLTDQPCTCDMVFVRAVFNCFVHQLVSIYTHVTYLTPGFPLRTTLNRLQICAWVLYLIPGIRGHSKNSISTLRYLNIGYLEGQVTQVSQVLEPWNDLHVVSTFEWLGWGF